MRSLEPPAPGSNSSDVLAVSHLTELERAARMAVARAVVAEHQALTVARRRRERQVRAELPVTDS